MNPQKHHKAIIQKPPLVSPPNAPRGATRTVAHSALPVSNDTRGAYHVCTPGYLPGLHTWRPNPSAGAVCVMAFAIRTSRRAEALGQAASAPFFNVRLRSGPTLQTHGVLLVPTGITQLAWRTRQINDQALCAPTHHMEPNGRAPAHSPSVRSPTPTPRHKAMVPYRGGLTGGQGWPFVIKCLTQQARRGNQGRRGPRPPRPPEGWPQSRPTHASGLVQPLSEPATPPPTLNHIPMCPLSRRDGVR